MKKLEQIFKDNAESFEMHNPEDGHLERFLNKLEKSHKKRNQAWATPFLKVAAVVVFVIVSGVVGYQIRNMQTNHYSLGEVSPKYREVELFYTSNINNQLNLIHQLGSFDNTQDQKILTDELSYMDEMYLQLEKELKLNPDDERIIQAMIEHYQVKTNILNRIIEQLYQIKKQKASDFTTEV